jgi:hypothetical protein
MNVFHCCICEKGWNEAFGNHALSERTQPPYPLSVLIKCFSKPISDVAKVKFLGLAMFFGLSLLSSSKGSTLL